MTSSDVLFNGVQCVVQPVVLFNICDSYTRNAGDADGRVIGTLLGSVSADGTVQVRDCYAVPHQETSDQVALDIDFHRTMYELHHTVHPRDGIVGWFSSGEGPSNQRGDSLFQDFYGREAGERCVHLTVDTSMAGGRMGVRAYVASPLSLGGEQLACQFTEVPLEAPMAEAERVGVELLRRSKAPAAAGAGGGDLAALEDTVERLQGMVETAHDYVEGVTAGRIAPDNDIGRHLAETVAGVPRLSKPDFERLVSDAASDALLVTYLTKLTAAQLALADRLGAAPPPPQQPWRE